MRMPAALAGPAEIRASAAHPRDPELADWFGTANTATRIRVTPRTALRCPAVYAPIRLLAGTISVMPANLRRKQANGGSEPAEEQPLFDLVHTRPNGWQTAAQFKRQLTEWVLGYANAYARVRNPGFPTALEPMHPLRVLPFRDSQGRVWYRYQPHTGPVLTLAAEEVIHLRYGPIRDTGDEIEAESPITLHQETIALAMAATEYLGRFFSNYAVPKGAIEVPAPLTDKAAEALRVSWERRHSGLENAHRLAILDGGMKFHELGMTNRDAEFLGLYRHISSEIASKLYGIPPHMVGDTEKQTSYGTGVEQQALGFVKFVISPIVQEWEETLNCTLLTRITRRRFFFDLDEDGLLRGDFKSRMEGIQIAVQWGIITVNEARERLNLPRVQGGDARMHPLNMVPADRIMDVLLKDTATATRTLGELLGKGSGEGPGERPFAAAA